MPTSRLAATLFVLATAGFAQGRTWVVDRTNGPGTDFLDLPPAIAGASDGDVLVVRAGDYSVFQTGKALTVLGQPGARVFNSNGTQPAVEITGLAAGKTFAMKRMAVAVFGSAQPLVLRNNAGRIHLESIATSPGMATTRDLIVNCPEVTLTDYRSTTPQIGLWILGSKVVLAGSFLAGLNGSRSWQPTPPVTAIDSELWLVDGSLQGGHGAPANQAPPQSYGPAPGLRATNSTVHLLGTPMHSVQAGGDPFLYFMAPVAAIQAPGSTIEIDPAIQLVTYRNAQPIEGAMATIRQRLAALNVGPTSIGGSLAATLRAGAGDAYVLAFGLPSDPTASPLGTLFVDLGAFAVLAQGTHGASGSTSFVYPVPNDAALRGASFALQGANAYAGSGRIGLTNGVVRTLD